jgi:hypothetical protein
VEKKCRCAVKKRGKSEKKNVGNEGKSTEKIKEKSEKGVQKC